MSPSAALTCDCTHKKTAGEYDFQARALAAGQEGSLGYRVFFLDHNGSRVSPWHSIPLFAGKGLVNMVCEIPRGTRAKFEVATGEEGNPIKQDTKKGKLRFYGIDMEWNYGMLPQTWEDPAHASADCGGYLGDNDPVDVVEIGDHDPHSGAVYTVKPIAALAMIDEGELDWKVVAVASSDARCNLVNSVDDLEIHFPGELSAIREWFRTYKTHDGKPLNKFELNETFVGPDYTLDVIFQTHGFWKRLISLDRGKQCVPGKLAIGDVPVITSCFDVSNEVVPGASAPAAALSGADSEAEETELALLEALSLEEKSVKSTGFTSGMFAGSLKLGA